jgi:hypothetical protein
MSRASSEKIAAISAAIARQIEELQGLGYTDAALMLRMARVEMLTRANCISDEEFRQLCATLEGSTGDHPAAAPVTDRRRVRGDGARLTRHGVLDGGDQLLQRKRLR